MGIIKCNFKEVKKLKSAINREILQYRGSEDNPTIYQTEIPNLFNRMYELDEPTWEELIMIHKDIIR